MIIDLCDITFSYAIARTPALQGVTFAVPPGQRCAIIGRTGAGKSTLCALCAGFVPDFYQGRVSGRACVDGLDVIDHPVAELVRHVGLVGSNTFSQISGARFSVAEEVAFGLENLGLARAEMIERVDWALQVMQIEALRDRSPYALSGGQQQRVVLAATLAMRPPVLILDEPTAQLDPPSMELLAALLRDLSQQGTTILFAEQRLEWAAELAERVIVLDAGQVLADGPAVQVLTDALLQERGIGRPIPTQIAAQAQELGLWPVSAPLPITIAALTQGLAAVGAVDVPDRSSAANVPLLDVPHLPRSPVSGSPIVQMKAVSFRYPGGVEALQSVDLTIGAGERIALLGRNGAGKSTLVRHLNGLLCPSGGCVLVNNHDTRTTSVAQCARHVGIVFQDIRNQLFARTVRDELRFGPRNLGYRPAQVDALVERSLHALGLTAYADAHPYDLPSAYRRLVAIAAVLALDSALFVLDEPTAGLDTASIACLISLIHDLAAQGKSIFVVSHDLDFCFQALDRVVLMRTGTIVLDTTWNTADSSIIADEVGLPISLRVLQHVDRPVSPA